MLAGRSSRMICEKAKHTNTNLQCNETYTEENIIPILPTKDTDKQRLIARGQNLAEQGLTHSLKKAPGSKKRKKHAAAAAAAEVGAGTVDIANGTTTKSTVATAAKQQAPAPPSRSNTSTPTPTTNNNAYSKNGIKNAATAMLTARVLEEEKERNKRRKLVGGSDNLDSLFTKEKKEGGGGGGTRSADFMTRGYTIPAAARR